ncbi:MAG: zinc ribbon domain-containing protein, partial [Clostridia bacterium]|nr:zinc ribbon domain-containing protein [Clostridia bacterium]
CKELREYIEEIDEDLGLVEEDLYVNDGEEEDYDDLNDDEDYEYDDDSNYYELECPACGEVICFDDSLDPESLVCPACGEKINDVELCDGECESCDNKICDEESF